MLKQRIVIWSVPAGMMALHASAIDWPAGAAS
jgi:hypothetical protein